MPPSNIDPYRTELPPKDKTPGRIVLAVVAVILIFAALAWRNFSQDQQAQSQPPPATETTDHCAGC